MRACVIITYNYVYVCILCMDVYCLYAKQKHSECK